MSTLQFLGATQTVTGSKYLVETRETRLLVDCGLFQGPKELRLRNWQSLPIPATSIDAVIITHAHVDHIGYLPRLVREGFAGPIYATPATIDLASVILPDSARLQEEEAAYANRRGYSKHHPALPLYTEDDARAALRLMKSVNYAVLTELGDGLRFVLSDAGHILGSSSVQLVLDGDEQSPHTVVVSGDLGRFNQPINPDPRVPSSADVLALESTYGDREHGQGDPSAALATIVQEAARRRGMLLIPAFAVGRTQHVLYLLRGLERAGRVPTLPVYLDSPMAREATALYRKYAASLDPDIQRIVAQGDDPFATADFHVVGTTDESKSLNHVHGPGIIIAGSGMATGGRILHHLKHRLPDPRTIVVFVGYQAAGTRGRRLLNGEPEVKMLGEVVPVRARIEEISSLSAHAGTSDLLEWLGRLPAPPRKTYLVHGEPAAQEKLRDTIRQQLGWPVEMPSYLDSVPLD